MDKFAQLANDESFISILQLNVQKNVYTHNCQMELDLILPLMMKIGNVTRTHHCHFTTLVYAFTFLLKVTVEATCSVNCSTFASARVHFKRCHTNDTEMNREARKQIFLSSLPLFLSSSPQLCCVIAYCVL